jgi:hypothetical protein
MHKVKYKQKESHNFIIPWYMSEPKKRIVIDPNFLKLPMKGGRTRKNKEGTPVPKPIKIRSESTSEKTIKRRALNYIRKQQEERYKRLVKGLDNEDSSTHRVDGKNYSEDFKSDFDDSLAFLQKLADQNAQKIQVKNSTLRQYPPVVPNSTLLQSPVFEKVFLEEPKVFQNALQNISSQSPSPIPFSTPSPSPSPIPFSKPMYGCLKGGKLPTYRTLKSQGTSDLQTHLAQNDFQSTPSSNSSSQSVSTSPTTPTNRLTPEQQRAELKQFLEKRKEEKQRVERVKRQHNLVRPNKKQKRTTTRTFRVGKSKHYPRIGVLIPNKTIRTQVLAKKQKIRETPLEDIRKYLVKKGLIRVGSSCPNDVLRQMYESSNMICGEIQNHNSDNLLYNYLHNAI